jgi:FdhE protein
MSGPGDRRGGKRQKPAGNYTNIGEVTDPAFVRLPTSLTLFAIRSARFAALAEGNPLSAYLVFLSHLAAGQHVAQDALAFVASVPQANNGIPLSRETLFEDDSFAQILDCFLQHAAVSNAPDAAQQAHAQVHFLPWPDRLSLAEAILAGAYPADQLGECLYVAAALQIHLTRLVAQIPPALLKPNGDNLCPACGSRPVASMIVGWADAGRARYCCCPLCATMWNYVRIKCTSCGSTAGISYYLVEGQSRDIAVETCTTCGTYIKHFHQHRNTEIEPLADDIASFGLDVLIRQKNFRRTTANPLMIVA